MAIGDEGGERSLEERAARAKYELGPEAERATAEPLPWGYARDRIGVMMVDPDRLYLYWEVTDEGIEAARRRLPDDPPNTTPPAASSSRPGPGLWLRIHDATGILFDGTNSISTLDIPVDREQRQWFVTLDRPGRDYCVEIGMRSPSGAFARIARSKRIELPHRHPWPETSGRWATGELDAAGAVHATLLEPAESAGERERIAVEEAKWTGVGSEPVSATAADLTTSRFSPPDLFSGASDRGGGPQRAAWAASGSGRGPLVR